MPVDANGNGSVRIGPFAPGTYKVTGSCYSHSGGDTPSGGYAMVTISGSQGSCSDGIQDIMDQWGLRGQIEDQIFSLFARRGIETTFQQACAVIEGFQPQNWIDRPEEMFQTFCRVGKSLIPAELVYRFIEQTGRTLGLSGVEMFGGGAANSWARQCETI